MYLIEDIFQEITSPQLQPSEIYAATFGALYILAKSKQTAQFKSLFSILFDRDDSEQLEKILSNPVLAYPPKLIELIQDYLLPKFQNYPHTEVLNEFIQQFKIDVRIHSDTKFIEIFDEQGPHLFNSPEDGNSFFHAIAFELNRRGLQQSIKHEEVRDQVICFLANNHKTFSKWIKNPGDFPQYLNRMAKLGEVADELMMEATAKCFNLTLTIIDRNNSDSQSKEIRINHQQANTKDAEIGLIRKNGLHIDAFNHPSHKRVVKDNYHLTGIHLLKKSTGYHFLALKAPSTIEHQVMSFKKDVKKLNQSTTIFAKLSIIKKIIEDFQQMKLIEQHYQADEIKQMIDIDIWNEIIDITLHIKEKIKDSPSDVHIKQLRVYEHMLRMKNIQELSFSLNETSHEILSTSSVNVYTYLAILTFPISLPILALISWIKRGTFNFFKTDGEILIEAIEMVSTFKKDFEEVHPSSTNQPPIKELRDLIMNNTIEEEKQITLKEHGRPSSDEAINSIHSMFKGINQALDNPGVAKQIQQGIVGWPLILANRVREIEDNPAIVMIDLYCEFSYLGLKPFAVSIPFFKTLIEPRHATSRAQLEKIKPYIIPFKLRNSLSKALNWVAYSSFWEPNFEELFYIAREMTWFANSSKNARKQAWDNVLKVVQHPIHKIQVLEEVINFCGDLIEDYTKDYEAISESSDEAEKTKRKRLLESEYQQMEDYLKELPDNYHFITPSALILKDKFAQVLELLLQGKWAQAHTIYYTLREHITTFMTHAFPDLCAMRIQFGAVFSLINADGYDVPYKSEFSENVPSDDEILQDKRHILSLYVQNKDIYAAINKDQTVIRVILEPANLQCLYPEIYTAIKEKSLLEIHCRRAILSALAKQGINPENDHARSRYVFEIAYKNFEDCCEILKKYNPNKAAFIEKHVIDQLKSYLQKGIELSKKVPCSTIDHEIYKSRMQNYMSQVFRDRDHDLTVSPEEWKLVSTTDENELEEQTLDKGNICIR